MQKSLNIKFDIIHSFSSAPVFALRGIISKFFARKTKIVHTLKSYSRSKFGNSFYSILNLTDAITIPTKVFGTKIKRVNNNKIHVILSHINTDKFAPKDKLSIKKKYGYDKKIVFYYGAMWEIKGAEYLIDAIPIVINKNPNALFIFAPRNKDWRIKKYQDQIAKMGMAQYCKFILKDVKIEDYVNMADLIVLPYPSLIGTEGNPSCLLEAMACKTPVVTTDLPEIRETTNDSVIFALPKSTSSLAKKIIAALKHYPEGLVSKAYDRTSDFKIKTITKQFIKLYKELIPVNK